MKPHTEIDSARYGKTALAVMITANIIMFAFSLILSRHKPVISINPMLMLTPGTDALEFLGGTGRAVIARYGNWWSLITANWLHGGILHLLFNMLALRTLVPLIVSEFGTFRMFTIYTLAGICGFYFSIVGNVYLTIGASSGICGLIGAAFYFGRSRGGPWGALVYRQTTGWVISLALFGFFIPNINNWSHAGGLIGGIILGWIFSYNDKRKENLADIGLSVCLAGITAWLLLLSVIQGVDTKFF